MSLDSSHSHHPASVWGQWAESRVSKSSVIETIGGKVSYVLRNPCSAGSTMSVSSKAMSAPLQCKRLYQLLANLTKNGGIRGQT